MGGRGGGVSPGQYRRHIVSWRTTWPLPGHTGGRVPGRTERNHASHARLQDAGVGLGGGRHLPGAVIGELTRTSDRVSRFWTVDVVRWGHSSRRELGVDPAPPPLFPLRCLQPHLTADLGLQCDTSPNVTPPTFVGTVPFFELLILRLARRTG